MTVKNQAMINARVCAWCCFGSVRGAVLLKSTGICDLAAEAAIGRALSAMINSFTHPRTVHSACRGQVLDHPPISTLLFHFPCATCHPFVVSVIERTCRLSAPICQTDLSFGGIRYAEYEA